MKSLKLLIFLMFTVFLVAALLPACNKAPETMTPTAIVTDITAQKDQYVQDFQTKVDEYQVKIDELKTKAETASGAVKDELNQKIEMLTAKQEEAKGKIEEIKTAGADTWDNVKAGADQLLTDIETLYNDALSLVK
jgi:peptidoglycan hydrolase CwlO-like protein